MSTANSLCDDLQLFLCSLAGLLESFWQNQPLFLEEEIDTGCPPEYSNWPPVHPPKTKIED